MSPGPDLGLSQWENAAPPARFARFNRARQHGHVHVPENGRFCLDGHTARRLRFRVGALDATRPAAAGLCAQLLGAAQGTTFVRPSHGNS
jgi:hypothetical protein